VPTYLWWLGTPPFGKQELTDALKICDSLVVDSSRFEAPYRSFLELTHLASSSHQNLGVGDLQWWRLESWRETIAQFFSPLDRRPFLNGIAEIGVDYAGEGRANRVAAALLIVWMASTLDWKLQRAAAGTGGTVVLHFAAEGWRPVQVALRSVPKDHLAQGEISAVRLAGAAGGKTFQLTVLRDPDRARRVAPDIGAGAFQSLVRRAAMMRPDSRSRSARQRGIAMSCIRTSTTFITRPPVIRPARAGRPNLPFSCAIAGTRRIPECC